VGDQLQIQNTFTIGERPLRASSSLVINETELRQFLDENLDAAVTASYYATIARAESAVAAARSAAPKIVLP
jgi:hypothetical protein